MNGKQFIKWAPTALTLIRFPIAIGLLLDAKDGQASNFFLPLLLVAAFTDVLDGYIARKFNVATVEGALLDGYADIALYGVCLISAYFIYPSIMKMYTFGIIALLLIQFISWTFSLVKFQKMTSYHTYTAKAWGISIGVSLIFLFGFGKGTLLPVMILAGLICNIEEIFITNIMPYWKAGILNYRVAISLRNEFLKV